MLGWMMLVPAIAAFAQPLPGAALPSGATTRVGVPVMRSLEYTYNRVSTDPGRYRAAGYRPWIAGLTPLELFAPAASSPYTATLDPLLKALGTANESTARFTHTEAGCLQSTVPKVPNLGTVLSLSLGEATMTTTHARARQCIYYEAAPAARSWLQPKTFARGKLAAVMHLSDETDFVDLASRTGVGTAVVDVVCANDVALSSGRKFNFGSFASAYVADFQFQIMPKPPAVDPDFKDYRVVFADSGVWKVLERNTVPACTTEGDVCLKDIEKCP
ncbi:MAG: hypothetical protein ACREQJ_05910 [Candidatus Binatia bacterium]